MRVNKPYQGFWGIGMTGNDAFGHVLDLDGAALVYWLG